MGIQFSNLSPSLARAISTTVSRGPNIVFAQDNSQWSTFKGNLQFNTSNKPSEASGLTDPSLEWKVGLSDGRAIGHITDKYVFIESAEVVNRNTQEMEVKLSDIPNNPEGEAGCLPVKEKYTDSFEYLLATERDVIDGYWTLIDIQNEELVWREEEPELPTNADPVVVPEDKGCSFSGYYYLNDFDEILRKDLSDGSIIDAYNTAATDAETIMFYDGDIIVIDHAGDTDERINADTGNTVWSVSPPPNRGRDYFSYAISEPYYYTADSNGNLRQNNLSDGSNNWDRYLGNGRADYLLSVGETLSYGKVAAATLLDANGDRHIITVDIDGNILWDKIIDTDAGNQTLPTTIDGDTVLIPKDDGRVEAYNAGTGNEIYVIDNSNLPKTSQVSAPVVDGKVFVVVNDTLKVYS